MLKCYHHPLVLNFRFRMSSLSQFSMKALPPAHIFCFTPLHLMTDAKDASTTMPTCVYVANSLVFPRSSSVFLFVTQKSISARYLAGCPNP